MVKASPGLSDGRRVGQHTYATLDLGKISSRYSGGCLVINAHFEASWTPVHKLDAALCLDVGNGSVHVFGDHISTEEETARHVLAVTWITLHHLVGWLEASSGDFPHGQQLVVGLFRRDDGRIGDQREVDARIGHQVGLELRQIHIQGTVETKRSGDGGHDLADQTVQVGVAGSLDVQVATTDVVDGLVVHHESTVRVLQSSVGGEDGIVGLHHRSGYLGSGVYGEFELGFLSVVHGEAFHQKRGKSGAGSATERAEDQEALKTRALIRELTDTVYDLIHEFLTDGVVSAGVVVGGVFLARDELFRVKERTVSSRANLVHDGRLEIHKHGARNVLTGAGLAEERVERVVSSAEGSVRWHQSVRLDSVLETVQLPARVANLASCLSNVDRYNLTHFR